MLAQATGMMVTPHIGRALINMQPHGQHFALAQRPTIFVGVL